MPRNGKEGILFSFIMSAIMIYVMAALNYGVRTGDVGTAAWSYAFFNWPLAYVIGMICDLCICTPSSRAIMNRFCAQTDRAVWKGITVKFLMVVLMTVFMTIFGDIMAFGPSADAVVGFFSMFPLQLHHRIADPDAHRRATLRRNRARRRRQGRLERGDTAAHPETGSRDRRRRHAK